MIVLSLMYLSRAVVHRAQPMRFIEDDQVPLAVLQQTALTFGPLARIDRSNRRRFVIPDAWVHGQEVAVEDFKPRSELVLHVLLPLCGQAGWSNDQCALCLAA